MALTNPVDIAIRDYRSRSNEKERLESLFLAFEFLLRVDALVLGAVFLQNPQCRDDKIRTMLQARKFSTGDWRDLLQNLVAVVPRLSQFGLQEWFREMESGTNGTLSELVRLRNLSTHAEERMQPQFVADTLLQAEPLFTRCFERHPVLGQFEERDSRKITLANSNGMVDCNPLMLSGTVRGLKDSLFLYRGCSANRNGYGVITGREYWDADAYRELVELLGSKVSSLEIVEASVPASVLAERMENASQIALTRLKEQRIYRPEITINRSVFDVTMEGFLGSNRKLVLIEGPSGAGKTSSIAQLTENRLTKKATTLFVSVEHLTAPSFPDSLGELLRIRGEMGTAFERLMPLSFDGHVLIVLDDLGVAGEEEKALLSLFRWTEHLAMHSCVKLCATIRSDRLHAFMKNRHNTLPLSVTQFQMPLLTTDELVTLAERLPVRIEQERNAILSNRRETALRLGELADGSVRRPGLAVATLNAVGSDAILLACSASNLYREILKRVVLNVSANGIPRFPMRGRIVRKIAEVFLDRGSTTVAIDDDAVAALLINPQTQEQSPEFESLIADQVLVETCDNFVAHVSFFDPRFFEFIAALSLPTDNHGEVISNLVHKSTRFPPALSVAAHYLIHTANSKTIGFAQTTHLLDSQGIEALMLEIALLDAHTFLRFIREAEQHRSGEIQSVLRRLIHLGEARLAANATKALIEMWGHNPSLASELRFLRAESLYESDEYDEAEKELSSVASNRLTHALMLRGVIAVSRDDYANARTVYESLLQIPDCCAPKERADALAGLGYVLGRTGNHADAEKCLREAISILEIQGDSKNLSEAYSDLAEILGEQGRIPEARELLEKSLQISQRAGFLIAIGIVEGLIAQLDLTEGYVERAEQGFQKLLAISRRVGNRWREAWALKRLSTIRQQQGRYEEAARLRLSSERINNEIKSKRR